MKPLAILCLCMLLPTTLLAGQPRLETDQWRQDLATLALNLEQLHPDFFAHLSEDDFDSAVAQLDAAIPNLSDMQIAIDMARIVAMGGDAHTTLSLRQPAVGFDAVPVELEWFSDGLVVTHVAADHTELLGGQVTRIGRVMLAEAVETVTQVISHENDAWLRRVLQDYLVLPGLLHGLGLSDDPASVSLTVGAAGEESRTHTVALGSDPGDSVGIHDPLTVPTILHRKDPQLFYWFQSLSESGLFYFKYNRAASDPAFPLSEFIEAMFRSMDGRPPTRLVFDLSSNPGGNSSLIVPFLAGLQERVEAGSIQLEQASVVIGPETFSSGMLNAFQIKMGAPDFVSLIGQPSGGKPNHFGEVRQFQLPNSGIVVSYSTRYFELTTDGDPESLFPDVEIGMTSSDLSTGRDPILEHLLSGSSAATSEASYALGRQRGLSARTVGRDEAASISSARVVPDPGLQTPVGLLIYSLRQSGMTVGEATVPAVHLFSRGRLLAKTQGSVQTGLAVANPHPVAVSLDFFFTDSLGQDFGHGVREIEAGGQFAQFLDEAPFSAGFGTATSFTVEAHLPVGLIALRTQANQDGDFLFTTLPIIDLDQPASSASAHLAHFLDGGGSQTEVLLQNKTDEPATGVVHFFDPDGAPLSVTIGGAAGPAHGYELSARGASSLLTSGQGPGARPGSIRVTPTSGATPEAVGLFSIGPGGVIRSQASVPAIVARQRYQLYVESSGDFRTGAANSVGSALAMSHPGQESLTVTLRYRGLHGSPTFTAQLALPPNGQRALFLHQIPGFEDLRSPYEGILTLSTTAGFAVVGLRARYNEQGTFLITATSPFAEDDDAGDRMFPHVVVGGGFDSKLVLFSPRASQESTGTVFFFTQAGAPKSLVIR